MKIRLIRSATVLLEYAGKKIIIDPYLSAKHALPSYTGKSRNPLVDLPCEATEVLAGLEAAFISHLHSDHFDPEGQRLLPKDLPLFCQPGDETALVDKGFGQVRPVNDHLVWADMAIVRTPCQHGSGEVLQTMGKASGFVLSHEQEPTVYWVGDTIWYDEVAAVIDKCKPAIIVTHSGGAVWGDNVPIIMNAEQTVAVCMAAPASTVIATHMEALDHTTVSRLQLRAAALASGISREQLLIPADGEEYIFDIGTY